MRRVFVDTLYWIAIIRPNDSWSSAAKKSRELLGDVILVTTDEILTEFLTALSRGGDRLRVQAAKMVREIISNPNVIVVPQSRESFLEGLELYELRPDKEYSLIDCVSMNVMKSLSISEVLTNDSHFSQEGFNVVITR